MLDFVLFYHRQYDNQMLFPLMLVLACVALQGKSSASFVYAILAGPRDRWRRRLFYFFRDTRWKRKTA